MGDAATIGDNDIVYTQDLGARGGVQGYIKGFSDKVSDYDFTVEDRNTKVGVEETSTLPPAFAAALGASLPGWPVAENWKPLI